MDTTKPDEATLEQELESLRAKVVSLESADRQRAAIEIALSDSEEELRSLLPELSDFVAIYDLDRILIYINRTPTTLTMGEVIGTHLSEFVPAGDYPKVREVFDRAVQTGEATNYRTWSVGMDGRPAFYSCRVVPLLRANRATSVTIIATDITGQFRAEQLLRRSHNELEMILNNVPSVILYKDANGRIVRANQAAADRYGVTPEDMADTLASGWLPSDAQKILEADEFVLKTGRPLMGDFSCVVQNGKMHWYRVDRLPYRDEQGEVIGLVVVAEDITTEKGVLDSLSEREQQLRHNLDELQMILDTLPVMVFIKDKEARLLRTNRAAAEHFGITPEDMVGTNSSVWIPGDAERLHGYDLEVMSTGCPMMGIVEQVTIKDEARWHRMDRLPFRDECGHTVGVLVVVQDVTPIKESEEALRESEARFRAIAENLPGVVNSYVVMPDGRRDCRYIGPGLEQLLGPATAKHIDNSVDRFIDLVHPDDLDTRQCAIETAHKGTGLFDCEYRVRTDDGYKWVRVTYQLLKLPGGVESWHGVIYDLTAQKEAEARIQKLLAELEHVTRVGTLGELAAVVAHDLNQPLAAIANYAGGCRHRLRTGTGVPEDLQPVLDRIVQQAEHAGGIVRQFDRMVRPTNLNIKRLDLNDAIREAEVLLRPMVQQYECSLVLELSRSVPTVQGEVVAIQQVLLNLVHNACEAMINQEPVGRRVTVKSKATSGGWVEVSVSDVGCGVPSDAADRLFDAFYTTKDGGMGMGLSISRSIVETHSGHLTYTTSDHEGTTFSFGLPSADGRHGHDVS